MSKDYKVSNDGTIFEIKEDGSISKLARIDENGNVFSFSSAPNTPTTVLYRILNQFSEACIYTMLQYTFVVHL